LNASKCSLGHSCATILMQVGSHRMKNHSDVPTPLLSSEISHTCACEGMGLLQPMRHPRQTKQSHGLRSCSNLGRRYVMFLVPQQRYNPTFIANRPHHLFAKRQPTAPSSVAAYIDPARRPSLPNSSQRLQHAHTHIACFHVPANTTSPALHFTPHLPLVQLLQ
jgi:hypothetical protein